MSRTGAHRAGSAAAAADAHSDPARRPRRHEHHLAAGDRRHLPDARHQSARAAERRRHPDRRRRAHHPAAALAAGRGERTLRQARAGRHRGRVEQVLPGSRAQVRRAEAGDVPRHDADGVRHRRRQDGAVLLPARQEGLHRPRLLRGAGPPLQGAGRVRAGLRGRARGRPSRADAAGRVRPRCARRSSATRAAPTRCRCAWSCRPTAWPACGPTAPTR